MVKSILIAVMLIFGGVAYADDVPLDAGKQQQVEAARQRAALAVNDFVAASQRAGITAAPVVVQSTETDWKSTVGVALASIATTIAGFLAWWAKDYMSERKLQGADANAMASAYGIGADVAADIRKSGGSVDDLTVDDPRVDASAKRLRARRPYWAKFASHDVAKDYIVRGAKMVPTTASATDPAAPVRVKSPGQQLFEQATPGGNWDVLPSAKQRLWERLYEVQSNASDGGSDAAPPAPAPTFLTPQVPAPPVSHPGVT